jgi:hypothetical protein
MKTDIIFSQERDQDALNATIEFYDGIVSFMGKEAMGFSDGV